MPCCDTVAAYELMERLRWGDEPECPRCGSEDVYKVGSREGGRGYHYRWFCRACSRQYTVRTGTVMAETRLSLSVWCFACWAACASRSGVGALQISRVTGITPKSARHLLSRIRYAMREGSAA